MLSKKAHGDKEIRAAKSLPKALKIRNQDEKSPNFQNA